VLTELPGGGGFLGGGLRKSIISGINFVHLYSSLYGNPVRVFFFLSWAAIEVHAGLRGRGGGCLANGGSDPSGRLSGKLTQSYSSEGLKTPCNSLCVIHNRVRGS